MRLVMCLGLVGLSACRASTVNTPCAAAPSTAEVETHFVTEVPITSRVPLLNEEASLIAGYREDGQHLIFSVIGLGYKLVDEDFARKSNPSALSRLSSAVNRYLAPGRWKPMVPGTKRIASDGITLWEMGNVTATVNADGGLLFLKDGRPFGVSPFDHSPRFPREDECHEKFEVELVGIAIEPVSQWVWVTYLPKGDEPNCSIRWVSAFQIPDFSRYPHQLAKPHPDSEME
jgi:hypothetical protein